MRKVYRNTYEGKLFGVCSGLADHFDTDPVLLRIDLFAVLCSYVWSYTLLHIGNYHF